MKHTINTRIEGFYIEKYKSKDDKNFYFEYSFFRPGCIEEAFKDMKDWFGESLEESYLKEIFYNRFILEKDKDEFFLIGYPSKKFDYYWRILSSKEPTPKHKTTTVDNKTVYLKPR